MLCYIRAFCCTLPGFLEAQPSRCMAWALLHLSGSPVVKETSLSEYPGGTLIVTLPPPDWSYWDQIPFTVDGSGELKGALINSLHCLHSHTVRPGFPQQSLTCLVPQSNLFVVQEHRNSRCLQGGTLNPWLVTFTV